MDFKAYVRNVPDFPVPGIQFKDLTTLWKDKEAFRKSIDALVEHYRGKKIDKIVAAEARGFIIGAPLAYALGVGFVPVRKAGKLPAEKISESYALEYGVSSLEVHRDAIYPGEKVVVVDDVLATGGTCQAIIRLVESLGGEVLECAFFVVLDALKGEEKISVPVYTLMRY
ncbi:Adenine phosphoribosyltransferase [Brevinematales bacterium NS]|nr:Adenine phosphoribosyltransferase [Brevinematales bacterium NS]